MADEQEREGTPPPQLVWGKPDNPPEVQAATNTRTKQATASREILAPESSPNRRTRSFSRPERTIRPLLFFAALIALVVFGWKTGLSGDTSKPEALTRATPAPTVGQDLSSSPLPVAVVPILDGTCRYEVAPIAATNPSNLAITVRRICGRLATGGEGESITAIFHFSVAGSIFREGVCQAWFANGSATCSVSLPPGFGRRSVEVTVQIPPGLQTVTYEPLR